MTIACIASIVKFTDPTYELIVVDNKPDGFEGCLGIRDDYHVFDYKYICNDKNETVYHSYNQGAELAKYSNLVFVQSDVYCHEKTINKLVKYLEKWDMAFPQQVPVSREDIKKIYEVEDGEETHIGGRDAGMIAITKKAFKKSGGWNGKLRNLLGERDFFDRCNDAGISWTDHTNALITHIMAGNNLLKDESLYNEEMAHDAKILNG